MSPKEPPGSTPVPTADIEVFPVLDRGWPADGFGPVAVIVGQLPDPAELRSGAVVMVRERGRPAQGFRRLAAAIAGLWNRPRRAHAAIRSTALLAHGYLEISARIDPRTGEELVWGLAATSGRSSEAR
jgi:hypothetical protein